MKKILPGLFICVLCSFALSACVPSVTGDISAKKAGYLYRIEYYQIATESPIVTPKTWSGVRSLTFNSGVASWHCIFYARNYFVGTDNAYLWFPDGYLKQIAGSASDAVSYYNDFSSVNIGHWTVPKDGEVIESNVPGVKERKVNFYGFYLVTKL
jgi:hypothetical protein